MKVESLRWNRVSEMSEKARVTPCASQSIWIAQHQPHAGPLHSSTIYRTMWCVLLFGLFHVRDGTGSRRLPACGPVQGCSLSLSLCTPLVCNKFRSIGTLSNRDGRSLRNAIHHTIPNDHFIRTVWIYVWLLGFWVFWIFGFYPRTVLWTLRSGIFSVLFASNCLFLSCFSLWWQSNQRVRVIWD